MSLFGVPLGRTASLHTLRRRLLPVVRMLRRYYLFVRLPADVHAGLIALVAFSSRPGLLLPDACGVSRFSRMEFSDMPGVSDCAGFMSGSRLSSLTIWPSAPRNGIGTRYD